MILLQAATGSSDTVPINISFIISILGGIGTLGGFLLYVLNTSNSGVRKAILLKGVIKNMRNYILATNDIQDIRLKNIEAFLAKHHEYHAREMPTIRELDIEDLKDDKR